jgi:hypothetical protein
MPTSPALDCTCRHSVDCNHECHGRHCDPREHVCSIEFLPDEGRPDAVGVSRLQSGPGVAPPGGLSSEPPFQADRSDNRPADLNRDRRDPPLRPVRRLRSNAQRRHRPRAAGHDRPEAGGRHPPIRPAVRPGTWAMTPPEPPAVHVEAAARAAAFAVDRGAPGIYHKRWAGQPRTPRRRFGGH